MGISVNSKGHFEHTEQFLKKITRGNYYSKLDKYAKEGVDRLSAATPVDTGKTAASWDYVIKTSDKTTTITWVNDNTIHGYYYGCEGDVPVVLLLVYGHGNQKGQYTSGNNFVTPAIEPVMQKIVDGVWTEVKSK